MQTDSEIGSCLEPTVVENVSSVSCVTTSSLTACKIMGTKTVGIPVTVIQILVSDAIGGLTCLFYFCLLFCYGGVFFFFLGVGGVFCFVSSDRHQEVV